MITNIKKFTICELCKALLNLIEKAMEKPVSDRGAENTIEQFGVSLEDVTPDYVEQPKKVVVPVKIKSSKE